MSEETTTGNVVNIDTTPINPEKRRSNHKELEKDLLSSYFQNEEIDPSDNDLREEELKELYEIEKKQKEEKKKFKEILQSFERSVEDQHKEIEKLQEKIRQSANPSPNEKYVERKKNLNDDEVEENKKRNIHDELSLLLEKEKNMHNKIYVSEDELVLDTTIDEQEEENVVSKDQANEKINQEKENRDTKQDVEDIRNNVSTDKISKWKKLNELLISNGFIGVFSSVDEIENDEVFIDSVTSAFFTILKEYERRGKLISTLEKKLSLKRDKTEENYNLSSKLISELKEKNDLLSRKVVFLNGKLEEEQKLGKKREGKRGKVAKSMKGKERVLNQKVSEYERKIKVLKDKVSKLKEDIKKRDDKEKEVVENAKKIYTSFYQKSPEVKSRIVKKEIELIKIYEQQKQSLVAENRNLKEQLMKKRATVTETRKPPFRNFENEDYSRVELEYKRLQNEYLSQRKTYELKMRLKEKTVKSLEKENKKIMKELQNRPSEFEWKEILKKFELMKKEYAKKSSNSFEVFNSPEFNYKVQKQLTELSAKTTRGIIKEVMKVLQIKEVSELIPTVRKTSVIISSIPKLKTFIKDVVSVCKSGNKCLGEPTKNISPKKVTTILQNWVSMLLELRSYQDMELRLIDILQKREDETIPFEMENFNHAIYKKYVVNSFHQLVLNSNKFQKVDSSYKFISKVGNPKDIYTQLIQHFSSLFEVKKLEGVLPSMNSIYLFVNETQNSLRVLKDILGLSPKATFQQILSHCKRIKPDTHR